jgi:hypothetical protein
MALRRAAVRIRDHVDPDASERHHRERFERRWLSAARTFDGCLALNGVLDPEGGEHLLTALAAFTPPPAEDDARTAAQRRADALVELCQHAKPDNGRSLPQLVVTVDLDELRDQVPAGLRTVDGRWAGATFASGKRVAAATLRRLACDASVIPAVLDGQGLPLDLGRSRRLASPVQRRALMLRDGQCRFPGCDRPAAWADIHHTTPWWAGGTTDLDRMVMLCRRHHVIVHEDRWTLVHDPTTGLVTAVDHTGKRHPLVSKPRGHSP